MCFSVAYCITYYSELYIVSPTYNTSIWLLIVNKFQVGLNLILSTCICTSVSNATRYVQNRGLPEDLSDRRSLCGPWWSKDEM